jgi:recombination protein RecR
VAGSDPIARLIHRLSRLPGIGEKSATRLAFHILRAPEAHARELATAILEVRERVRLCSVCCNLTEADPCELCASARRDAHTICVVGQPTDLIAIERGGSYRGMYHVLHGVLSPLDGIGPEDLRIAELVRRLGPGQAASPGTTTDATPVTEVILATSPNVEGEATAMYLARLIKPLGVKVTRIASGVPIGGELEYVDQVTLTRALDGRREV